MRGWKIKGVVLSFPGQGHALLAVPRARASLKCPEEELVWGKSALESPGK